MLSLMRYANSVDVLGDDGMMRYGRVVDVAEGGLFVDLLYPNRRREYVPFDRLFLPSETSEPEPCRFNTEESSTSVEVLMPESSSGVLIWLPGQTVSLARGGSVDDYGGAIVHWRGKDTGLPCTDFVPIQRIRWPKKDALTLPRETGKDWRCLAEEDASMYDPFHPGPFVKHTVQLDNQFPLISSEEAHELIKRMNDSELRGIPFPCKVDVVEIVDGRLGYVYQQGYKECTGVCDPKDGRLLASLASFQAELLRVSTLLAEIPATDDGLVLRMELWQEVLSYLDTVTQMKLRTVCATWNQMIESPALRGWITLRDYAGSKFRFAKYLRLAAVYKRLQPGTHHLATQSDNGYCPMSITDVMHLSEMIRFVAQHQPEIRLKSLHLSRFTLGLQINAAASKSALTECLLHQSDLETVQSIGRLDSYRLENFVAAYGGLPCDTVYFTDCDVNLFCCFFSRKSHCWVMGLACVDVNIPSARLPIGRDFHCALWGALEAALPMLNEQVLREFLARLKREEECKLRTIVCTMLCAMQSADPRPSAHYRGKKWCVDGLEHLQLAHLSRISRHFLFELHRDKDA